MFFTYRIYVFSHISLMQKWRQRQFVRRPFHLKASGGPIGECVDGPEERDLYPRKPVSGTAFRRNCRALEHAATGAAVAGWGPGSAGFAPYLSVRRGAEVCRRCLFAVVECVYSRSN